MCLETIPTFVSYKRYLIGSFYDHHTLSDALNSVSHVAVRIQDEGLFTLGTQVIPIKKRKLSPPCLQHRTVSHNEGDGEKSLGRRPQTLRESLSEALSSYLGTKNSNCIYLVGRRSKSVLSYIFPHLNSKENTCWDI